MKTVYFTEDGKKFETKEAAERHERELNAHDEVGKAKAQEQLKEFLEKIKALESKRDAIDDEINKLYDEQGKKLAEYRKKYATPEEAEFYDKLKNLMEKIDKIWQ